MPRQYTRFGRFFRLIGPAEWGKRVYFDPAGIARPSNG
jgi:hypothetical protein